MGPRQHRDRHDWHSGRCPLAPAGVILGPSGWPLGTAASDGRAEEGGAACRQGGGGKTCRRRRAEEEGPAVAVGGGGVGGGGGGGSVDGGFGGGGGGGGGGGAGDQGTGGEGGVEDAAVMQERQTPVLRRCRGSLAAGGPVRPESVRALLSRAWRGRGAGVARPRATASRAGCAAPEGCAGFGRGCAGKGEPARRGRDSARTRRGGFLGPPVAWAIEMATMRAREGGAGGGGAATMLRFEICEHVCGINRLWNQIDSIYDLLCFVLT